MKRREIQRTFFTYGCFGIRNFWFMSREASSLFWALIKHLSFALGIAKKLSKLLISSYGNLYHLRSPKTLPHG